ncbi:MAG: hydrogenase maturation protease [Asgard group archaeon]|nr:hydrogenase maturation protease [Asgard group archaeon]
MTGKKNNQRKKLHIIGLGNPNRSDDALGLTVTKLLQEKIKNNDISFSYLLAGGIDLLYEIENYEYVIIIDAFQLKDEKIGKIFSWEISPDNIPTIPSIASSHEFDLIKTISLGFTMKASLMPQKIYLIGMQVENTVDFSLKLTDKVRKKIPKLIEKIYELINKII